MKYAYQQNFRVIPCTQPLKSPSPDRKNQNLIIATCSPTHFQMNRRLDVNIFNSYTPKNQKKQQNYYEKQKFETNSHSKQFRQRNKNQSLKKKQFNQFSKNSEKLILHKQKQYSTQAKNSRFQHFITGRTENIDNHNQLSQRQNLFKSIKQKDQIIGQLKKIINMMTQNGKHLKHSESSRILQDNQYLKHQVDVLTIQNQKLLGLIQKMKIKSQNLQKSNTKKSQNQKSINKSEGNNEKILQEYKRQIKQLSEILVQKEQNHEKQIDQLIKSHKSLAIQCKSYENEKETYKKQNEKLLNLLKLKDKQFTNNFKHIFNTTQNISSEKQYHQKQKSFQTQKSKLSLMKIKEQQQENFKHLKNSLYYQIEKVVENMNSIIQTLTNRVNQLQERISRFQQLKQSVVSQDHTKKSQIYIQEAPSSERYSIKKGSLSRILQQSRKSNQKLQIQLQQTKTQLQNYRRKVKQLLEFRQSQRQQNPPTFGQDRYWNQGQYEQLKEKIKFLQKELGNTIRQKQQKQKELIQLQLKVFKVEQERLEQQGKMKLQVQTKQKLINTNSLQIQNKLNEQILSLKKQIQAKNERISELQMLFQSKQAQYQQLQQSNFNRQQALLKEIDNFQKFIQQTQLNYKTQKENHRLQVQQLTKQQQKLTKQVQRLTLQVQKLTDQVQRLTQQGRRLTQKYDQQKSQFNQLQQRSKQIQVKYLNQLKELSEKSERVQTTIIEKDQALLSKQKILSEREQQVKNILNQRKQKDALFQKYQGQLQTFNKQNQLLKLKQIQLQQQKSTLLLEIKSGKSKQQQLIVKIAQLQNAISNIQNQKKNAEKDNSILRTDIQNKNSAIESIILQIGRNNQKSRLKTNQMIQSIIIQIQEIQDLNDQLTNKNQTIQASLESSLSEKQSILKQNNQLTKQIFSFSQQRQILIQKIKYLQASIKIYEKQLTQRKQFCDQLISKHAIIEKQLSIQSRSRIIQKDQKQRVSSGIKNKIKIIIENQNQQGQNLRNFVQQIKKSKLYTTEK